VFALRYCTLYTNCDFPNWNDPYMELYIVLRIIVFAGDEDDDDSKKPDDQGSNDELKKFGKRLENVAAEGKSWQEY
jgi:hypothetical protein